MKATSELHSTFRDLRFRAIPDVYSSIKKQAENEGLSYDEFLLRLLKAETEQKRVRKIMGLLRRARLPHGKTLSSFEEERVPLSVRRKLRGLLDGGFLERKENLLVFGKPGSGKTHLVCAVAHELIQKGHSILFTTAQMLVQDLLMAKRDLFLKKQIRKLAGYDAVIVDDIGYVQQSREEMEVLFTLLAERYETGSLMLTSNLPFSKWEQIFKDPMTTAAAIDRLVHHSLIIELNVQSYRMDAAKSRKSGQE